MKTIGLTLSGGAIRGVIHLGVIKALEEFGLKPEVISGTSMGSVIGGLYSIGMSYKEILDVTKSVKPDIFDIDWKGISKAAYQRKLPIGIIKGDNIERLIENLSGGIYVGDITNNKIGIVTTNLNGGDNVVFTNHMAYRCNDEQECIRNIKLSKAVRASISLPFIFKPVIIGDYVLVDGGVVNNCPANVAQKLGAKFIIISDIDYNGCRVGTNLDGTSLLFATLDVIVKEACDDDMEDITVPKLVLNFGDVDSANMFKFTEDEINKFFNIGYERAINGLKSLDENILL